MPPEPINWPWVFTLVACTASAAFVAWLVYWAFQRLDAAGWVFVSLLAAFAVCALADRRD